MGSIPPCGTPWVLLGWSREFSRGTLWVPLVLHKLVRSIAADSECSELLFNMWYLDDGTLAGPKDAVKHAIHLIQHFGPSLGLYTNINMAKCELFSRGAIEGFPADIKVFHVPNFEILGAHIGDAIFCAKFLAQKRAKAVKLLSQMSEVGSVDPQIALLLRHCATFCKLVHLARSTPPALVSEGLALFDVEVRRDFCDTVAIDPSDSEWLQVQLSLSRGSLGLRRLALHCSAAYLASVNKAGCSAPLDEFTLQAVAFFDSLVPPASSISEESLLEPCLSQNDLSIDDHLFDQLLLISTPANHACLLSAASCHASSWLAIIPS